MNIVATDVKFAKKAIHDMLEGPGSTAPRCETVRSMKLVVRFQKSAAFVWSSGPRRVAMNLNIRVCLSCSCRRLLALIGFTSLAFLQITDRTMNTPRK